MGRPMFTRMVVRKAFEHDFYHNGYDIANAHEVAGPTRDGLSKRCRHGKEVFFVYYYEAYKDKICEKGFAIVGLQKNNDLYCKKIPYEACGPKTKIKGDLNAFSKEMDYD